MAASGGKRQPPPGSALVTAVGEALTVRRWFPVRWGTAEWVALGTIAALAVGLVASVNVRYAVALTLAVSLLLATALRTSTLLLVLAVSLFLELVQFGGVNFSRVAAPVAAFVVAVELLRGGARLRWAPPLGWAAAYSLWALASGMWTVSSGGTLFLLQSLLIALVYMLAFATLVNTEKDLRWVLYALALAATVIGAVSVLAYSGIHVPFFTTPLGAGRASGGVGDANFFAAFQLLAFPLVLILAADAKRSWLRVALSGALLVVLASIFASLSRGAFVAAAILIPFLLFLPARALARSPRQKAAVLLLVALGGVAAMTSAHLRGQVGKRIASIYHYNNTSAAYEGGVQGSGRIDLWLAAKTAVVRHPLLGLGYGGFPPVSDDLLRETPGVNLDYYPLRPEGAPVHNTYLETLAELGPLGLLLYLGAMLSSALALRRAAVRARRIGRSFVARVANGLLLGLLTWAITSVFLSMETARGFWIIFGLSVALPKLLTRSSLTTSLAGSLRPSSGVRGT